MMSPPRLPWLPREAVLHALYEAAELEHNLMCTYLYAAFSLKDGEADGVRPEELEALGRWRKELIGVAIEEMGHLTAVWNITAALGGTPRFGRTNFPLDPGYLPAGIVVSWRRLPPETLQHFVFLERPSGCVELDGEGFVYERNYIRGGGGARLIPMGFNYDTVGDFYIALSDGLRTLVGKYGEANTLRRRSGPATLAERARPHGREARDLPQDRARGVRCHRRTGRRRTEPFCGSHYQKFVGHPG